MPIDPRQYDSAVQFIDNDREFSRLVRNLSNGDDRMRLKAYELYEDMYHNRPEHISVTLRGEDDDAIEIYIPSAKKYIEAVNRFLAVDFDYQVDPDVGSTIDQQAIDVQMSKVFKYQEIATKFNQMKRYYLMKGDALMHVHARPWERPGRRICLQELKPEHYFPIEDPVTGYQMGCHIVDIILNPKNDTATKKVSDEYIVRRQTYRRVVDKNNVPTGPITTELSLWKIGAWDDRVPEAELIKIKDVEVQRELPALITNIPVYHWANNRPPNSTFGMSELAGIESIINAINQAMTDEDLTLVTQGLGVYWTNASPPVDENGNEVEWEIGPGSVVQVGVDGQFGRVSGVSGVTPFHDHVSLLDENAQQALGIPDVAIGMVDVQTVESGIALDLKFGPLLAHVAEKMPVIQKITDELLEDLLLWIEQYEGVTANGVELEAIFGDPMPKNKSQQLADLLSIWSMAPDTLSVEFLYDQLNDIMGWDLDYDADFPKALDDAKQIAEAGAPPVDPFGQQMGEEQGAGGQGQGGGPPFGNNGSPISLSAVG